MIIDNFVLIDSAEVHLEASSTAFDRGYLSYLGINGNSEDNPYNPLASNYLKWEQGWSTAYEDLLHKDFCYETLIMAGISTQETK
jgi:ribosome modulation factor